MGCTHYWTFDPHAADVGKGFVRTAMDAADRVNSAGQRWWSQLCAD
jgi:hypothetical protein